jgi:hypothetical protein
MTIECRWCGYPLPDDSPGAEALHTHSAKCIARARARQLEANGMMRVPFLRLIAEGPWPSVLVTEFFRELGVPCTRERTGEGIRFGGVAGSRVQRDGEPPLETWAPSVAVAILRADLPRQELTRLLRMVVEDPAQADAALGFIAVAKAAKV